MYDARKKCDKAPEKDGPLCYKEMGWMETYLNQPDVKRGQSRTCQCSSKLIRRARRSGLGQVCVV